MVRACAVAVLLFVALRPFGQSGAWAQDDNPFAVPAEESAPSSAKSDGDPFGDSSLRFPAIKKLILATVAKPEVSANAANQVRPCTNALVREALESPTRIEFIDMPLQDAINFLKDFHQIEIQLDMRALEDAGIGSDTPVTRELGGVPLKSALRLMLEDLDLAYVVRENVLFITSKQKASTMRELRVYDVATLLPEAVKAAELGTALTRLMPDHAIDPVPLGNLLIVRATQDEHDEILELIGEIAKSLPAEQRKPL